MIEQILNINFRLGYKINRNLALKLILLFALINSSIYISLDPSGIFRLIIAALMNISGVLVFIFFIKTKSKFKDLNIYFRLILPVLLFWSLFTVGRAFVFDAKALITLFGHYLIGWAWVPPFAFVFGLKMSNWNLLYQYFNKLLIIGCILGLVFFQYIYTFGLLKWVLFFPFFLLSFNYQKRRRKILVGISIFVFILLSIYNGQRINFLFLVILIGFSVFEYFRITKISLNKKIGIFIVLTLLVLYSISKIPQITNEINKRDDLTTDTRTFLFIELFNDMSFEELRIGRGAMGTYFSPFFEYTEKHGLWGDSPTRSVNEVGYLQMILKGGWIMMGLYLLILFPSAYLGIFKSNNFIARACGYYILGYLITWTISYYPTYSCEYILVWISAGTCMSNSLRKMTNKEIVRLEKDENNFLLK